MLPLPLLMLFDAFMMSHYAATIFAVTPLTPFFITPFSSLCCLMPIFDTLCFRYAIILMPQISIFMIFSPYAATHFFTISFFSFFDFDAAAAVTLSLPLCQLAPFFATPLFMPCLRCCCRRCLLFHAAMLIFRLPRCCRCCIDSLSAVYCCYALLRHAMPCLFSFIDTLIFIRLFAADATLPHAAFSLFSLLL